MHLSTLSSKFARPLALSLLTAVGGLALTARAETHVSVSLQLGPPAPVVVREAPPQRTAVERPYNTPGPGYVWVPGHNSWVQGRWVWIPGTWARPPQPTAIYVEGRWDERSRNWIEPHWEIVEHPARAPHYDDRRGPPAPEVIVVAPPPPRKEHRHHRPSPEYVWVEGYWAWHGNHHEWVTGRWALPPHGRRSWETARWEHHGDSYVFVEGRWR